MESDDEYESTTTPNNIRVKDRRNLGALVRKAGSKLLGSRWQDKWVMTEPIDLITVLTKRFNGPSMMLFASGHTAMGDGLQTGRMRCRIPSMARGGHGGQHSLFGGSSAPTINPVVFRSDCYGRLANDGARQQKSGMSLRQGIARAAPLGGGCWAGVWSAA